MQLASLINLTDSDDPRAWPESPGEESGAEIEDPPAARSRPGAGVAARADAPSLAALMARVVERDERALAQLYDETSSRVYGLALRICRRAAMAEEVLEDAYWQAWRQAPRFDPGRGEVMTVRLHAGRCRHSLG